MRSVYKRILAWSLLTLVVSFLGFILVSNRFAMQIGLRDIFPRLQTFELQEAADAYETGGQVREAALIARLNNVMGGTHYFLDSHGKGSRHSAEDRADLFKLLNGRWDQMIVIEGGMLVASRTADGRYVFIVEAPIRLRALLDIPSSITGLILPRRGPYLLAARGQHRFSPARSWPAPSIASSARAICRSARNRRGAMKSGRSPVLSIGMADRIETLLTAERRLAAGRLARTALALARLSFPPPSW